MRDRLWVDFASAVGSLLSVGCLALAAAACGADSPAIQADTEDGGTGSGSGMPASTTLPDATNGSGDPATSDASAGPGTGATDDGPADSGGPADSTDGGNNAEGCCEPHASPSCNEPDVADCVCAANAACCAFEWARACADAAVDRCAAVCDADPTGDTGDSGEPGDTGGNTACARTVQIELDAADATLTGGWQLQTSMLGEGEIAAISGQADGSVLWEPDIPCDDTWYIWVRYFENGGDDSYFATLDGEPNPAAVFEGDCTFGGDGWGWALLNWRDEATQGACEYTEDPWAPDWTAGVHAIELSYRETIAVARIVVTNDEAFTP
jgi:hypothetical protein